MNSYQADIDSKIRLVLILLFILCSFGITHSQPGGVYLNWHQTYGHKGEYNYQLYGLAKSQDTGLYAVGSINSGQSEIWFEAGWVIRTDDNGNTLWEKTFEADSIAIIYDICTPSQDQILIGGSGNSNFVIASLGITGDIIWKLSYDAGKSESVKDVIKTNDGGYIMAGITEEPYDNATRDILVVKLDSLRNIQWENVYAGSNYDNLVGLIETSNGYVIISESDSNDGQFMNGFGSRDIWLIGITKEGLIRWRKSYGDSNKDYLSSFMVSEDNQIVLSATTNTSEQSYSFIITTDLEGNEVQRVPLNMDNPMFIRDTYTLQNEGFISVGLEVNDTTYKDSIIRKFYSSGNVEWSYVFHNSYRPRIHKILEASPNKYLVMGIDNGDAWNFGQYGSESWIVEIEVDPILTTLEPREKIKIYPNPVDGRSLWIDLGGDKDVTLTILNFLGQKIDEMNLPFSLNHVTVSSTTAGAYFFVLTSKSGEVFSKKVIMK